MSLPALIRPESFPGADSVERWKAYIEGIYEIFNTRIVKAPLMFQSLPIKCRYHEPYDGKHMSFWHVISEGTSEADRTPDPERCARISWIPWVIRYANDPQHVRWWENERSTQHGLKTRTPLWLFNQDYAVILERREGVYFLITSYCLTPRRADTFQKEWEEWTSKQARTRMAPKKAEAAN